MRYTDTSTPLSGWTSGGTSIGANTFRFGAFVWRDNPMLIAGFAPTSLRVFSPLNFPNTVDLTTLATGSFSYTGTVDTLDVGDGIAILGSANTQVGLFQGGGTVLPLGAKLPYALEFPTSWIGKDGRLYVIMQAGAGANACKVIRSGRRKVYVPTGSIALQEALFGPYADLYGTLDDGSPCRVSMNVRMGVPPWRTNVRTAF